MTAPTQVRTLLQPLALEPRRQATLRGLAVAALSMLASLIITSLYFVLFEVPATWTDYAIALVVPALIATPICVWLFTRIEQINQAYAKLDTLASTDWLTECLNRRAFTTAVAAASASRTLQALIVIDVDRFKAINDSYGHDCGDDALRQVADAIRRATAVGDIVGRLGGEEFGVLVDIHSPGEAVMRAEQIRAAVASIDFRPAALQHPISVSLGIAVSAGPMPFADLFRTADRCLYEAKLKGRNRVSAAFAKQAA